MTSNSPTVRLLDSVRGIPANYPEIQYRRREDEYNSSYAHRLALQYLDDEDGEDVHSLSAFIEDVLNELCGEWVEP